MYTLYEIVKEHMKYRAQIIKLAKSNILKTYKGSALGMSWAIIKPTIYMAVYYFAFTVGLRSSSPVGEYSYFLWLLSGMVPWFFMRDTFTSGAGSIRKYRYLVTRVKFPVCTIPTFTALSDLAINIMITGIMIVLFLADGHWPDIYWLQIPLYTFLMFLFFSAWSLFAGVLGAISTDFLQLIKSLTIALFWLSGIMYQVSSIDNIWIRRILLFNPITIVVDGYRNSLIYKEWFWENLTALRNFAIVYAIMLVLAVWIYRKLRKDLPDVL